VDQAAAYSVIQQGPQARICFDPFDCGENINRKLIAKAWLVIFVVVDGKIQLCLSVGVEDNLHQLNRRQMSSNTSSPATDWTAPVVMSWSRFVARSAHF